MTENFLRLLDGYSEISDTPSILMADTLLPLRAGMTFSLFLALRRLTPLLSLRSLGRSVPHHHTTPSHDDDHTPSSLPPPHNHHTRSHAAHSVIPSPTADPSLRPRSFLID